MVFSLLGRYTGKMILIFFQKKPKAPPLSDMVQFCKDHYQCKRSFLPKYEKCEVSRRTLSPRVSHQLTYSTKEEDNVS